MSTHPIQYHSVSTMLKYVTLLPICFLTLSCQSGPNFRQMSAQELGAYNMDKPVEERIYCYMKEHTRSRIPRLVCETLAQIYGGSGSDAQAINNAIPTGPVFETN
ncbi:MAG: hypothetical protein GKR91_05090 [Pseudomonadales bacterium]|nr:hypothetical protein [Pseudomonadales bacterium]